MYTVRISSRKSFKKISYETKITKSQKQLFPALCVEVFTEEVMFHVEPDVVMEVVPLGIDVVREESGRGERPRRHGDQKAHERPPPTITSVISWNVFFYALVPWYHAETTQDCIENNITQAGWLLCRIPAVIGQEERSCRTDIQYIKRLMWIHQWNKPVKYVWIPSASTSMAESKRTCWPTQVTHLPIFSSIYCTHIHRKPLCTGQS